jgi:glutamate racemase
MAPRSAPSVALVAATPVDTRLGCELLARHGFHTMGRSVSATPQEQTMLQAFDRDTLSRRVIDLIGSAPEVSAAVIYCNSLSGAINLEQVRCEAGVPVATPLDLYAGVARRHRVLGVIAANGQSVAHIERSVLGGNPDARVVSYANLGIVQAIERGDPPERIVRTQGLDRILDAFMTQGVECIIMGCTHFTVLEGALAPWPVYNPDAALVSRLRVLLRGADGNAGQDEA